MCHTMIVLRSRIVEHSWSLLGYVRYPSLPNFLIVAMTPNKGDEIPESRNSLLTQVYGTVLLRGASQSSQVGELRTSSLACSIFA